MDTEIKILEHARDRYLRRVKGVNPEIASEDMRMEANSAIEEAVTSPLVKYHGKADKPPVHIKGEVAVPVDAKNPGDKRKSGVVLLVPTAYNSSTFVDKINERVRA